MTISPPNTPSLRERDAARFQQDLVALIPNLRAFARGLCSSRSIAEDMAQEALSKAWRARDRFEPGTNLKAWLFTILRNEYFSQSRRAWRESHWDTEKGERIPGVEDAQDWTMALSDMARALDCISDSQREALILVAAGGFSYEDTAGICGVPVGTVKSRVARARVELMSALDGRKPLPCRPIGRAPDALKDILSQLSALTPASHRQRAAA